MDRSKLLVQLENYRTEYKEEGLFVGRFLSLLRNFPTCFTRALSTGHVTGSAWIMDGSGQHVLLTHHRKLNRWLQPGGHADGNEHVLQVALSEAEEETGLTALSLVSDAFFDIDIHAIPARGELQCHLHYDLRYLFLADKEEPFTVSHESHDLAWVPLPELDKVTLGNRSILRMAQKAHMYLPLKR
jgi:8-oxo-dGTP pyrophosphatase MutT (NUDIX family)